MRRLSNLKISARLFGGFGIVLGLMVLLAATVSINLIGTSQDVVDYRWTAVNTNQGFVFVHCEIKCQNFPEKARKI